MQGLRLGYLSRESHMLSNKINFTNFGQVDLWQINFESRLNYRFQIKENPNFKSNGRAGTNLAHAGANWAGPNWAPRPARRLQVGPSGQRLFKNSRKGTLYRPFD